MVIIHGCGTSVATQIQRGGQDTDQIPEGIHAGADDPVKYHKAPERSGCYCGCAELPPKNRNPCTARKCPPYPAFPPRPQPPRIAERRMEFRLLPLCPP